MSETPPSLEEQLAAAARESTRDDALLERLAAGQLTPAERLELERRASVDPDLRQAIELCQPLDAASRERVVHRLTEGRSNVVALEPRRARRWVMGGLALAAGLTAAIVLPRLLGTSPATNYTLEASGDATQRSAPSDGPLKVSAGSRVVLVARPASATTPPGHVQASIAPGAGGSFQPLEATVDRAPDGAVRVVLEGSTLGAPGAYRLRLVLGEGDTAISLETSLELTP